MQEVKKENRAYGIVLAVFVWIFLAFMVWMHFIRGSFADILFWGFVLLVPAAILLYKQFVTLRIAMPRWLFRTIVTSVSLVLLILQLNIFPKIYVIFDWDAQMVTECANAIVIGADTGAYAGALTASWNNRFLVGIFSVVIRIKNLIAPDYSYYGACVIASCLFANIGVCLTAYTLDHITHNKKLTFVFWIVCILLYGMSPWLSYPYSDCIGVPFSVLTLYLYTLPKGSKGKERIKFAAIGLSGAIAYAIKPQCSLLFIAIFGVQLIRLIAKPDRRETLWRLGLLFAGFAVGFAVTTAITYALPIQKQGTKLTPFHFFYMGMNAETHGMYNYEDYLFSLEHGAMGDLTGGFERIKAMGIGGFFALLNDKMFYSFYNPLFGWGTNGYVGSEAVGTPWVQFWQNVYYTGYAHSESYTVFLNVFWLFLLTTSCFAVFWKKGERDSALPVIAIALIGAFLMSLFLECHAKYLLVQVPLFCCLAAGGLKSFSDRVSIPRMAECMQELFVKVKKRDAA